MIFDICREDEMKYRGIRVISGTESKVQQRLRMLESDYAPYSYPVLSFFEDCGNKFEVSNNRNHC
ncbi:unnamed protein product [Arabidopsis lyrata]|nr:unnamed protein product [Arabidopsis lyrata]